jgi:molybdopterin-guanine dinucleotide biosynthesis protein A
MTTQFSSIRGLILAGGRSSRMGRDKGGIIVHGKTQREYLFDELSSVCVDVSTSCRKDQEIPQHLHPIIDAFPIDSPLNGILSAFQTSQDSAWLAVAVDMPYVDRNVFAALIDSRDISKVATCFYNSDTKLPEPLLTIWEPSAFPLLIRFAEGGNKSPRDFLSSHAVNIIQPPDHRIFYNMNTPDEVV